MKEINILIGGDFFTDKINIQPLIKVEHLFIKADLSIINLEGPITNSNKPILKTGPSLKMDSSIIDCLKSVDIVTLANNHIKDYGQTGIEDTLKLLEDNKIEYLGGGKDLQQAQKIIYKTIKGVRISFVNIAENEWSSATIDSGGANPMNIIDNVHQIKNAKQNSDHVILIIHGGHERFSFPSPRMKNQYRFYADNGADVIVGHHPHCINGFEEYNKSLIFYSIGNLFFPSKTNYYEWYKGMFISLKISKTKEISFKFHPYYQSKEGVEFVELMNKNDLKLFNIEMDDLNLVVNNQELLDQKWHEFINFKYENRLLQLSGKNGLFWIFLKKLGIVNFFINRMNLTVQYNLLRCESHREISLESLAKYYENNSRNS